ncbi:hypothetical protein F1C79_15675 [Pseudomonas denitrificans (nom. rej.)]|uniref:Uncharacterized protein n=1 Tax=Pseudomonas denitrificans TaxID=43306 RepID=A0A9X7R5Q8_PSEDE|nr:hypothetical protein F1C79_15675 [Pseudomonas denitrificans (nom. rej.)]
MRSLIRLLSWAERKGNAARGGIAEPRDCCRFAASRVAAPNRARLDARRRQWSFPCLVPQRRMARFAAQPEGPARLLRSKT